MLLRIFVAAFALAVLATGCYSPAHRLEVSTVKPITAGTTRAEVEKRLGPPKEVERGSNGTVVARYFFHEYHRSEEASRYGRFYRPGDLLYRTLSLLYSSTGVVEKRLYDESINSFHQEWNGWAELGRPFNTETVHIAESTDTTKSLIERFGEPTTRTLDASGRVMLQWFYFRGRVDRLGQPEAKLLTITMDNDVAQAFSIQQADPRFWPYLRFFQ